MKEVVILGSARTPIGGFMGSLKDIPAPKLGAVAIREAVRRSGVPLDKIDECYMGCVLTSGLGQAPARQAAIYAELPLSVTCTTIGRVCGSGLRSVMFAAQAIATGDANVIVAGGMESMSRAPFLFERTPDGPRIENAKPLDAMVHDGLWDVYNNFHMGSAGELCAKERKIDRAAQDRYAVQSYQRAQDAIAKNKFKEEIVAVEVGGEKGVFSGDEEPAKAKFEKFPTLKTVFQKENGTITAANASSLSDGAAALVVASADTAKALGVRPLARIVAQANHAQAPEWFTTAPVGAIKKALAKANLEADQIDLYEINEAFSVVALACVAELGIPESKVTINGGAVALGHPIGASGARILTTLLHSLRAEKKRYGLAALCIGGGEASALVIEALY